MSNLQQLKEKRDAGLAPAMLRRLWFWAPTAAGGALAALLLSAVALPQWLGISRDQQRLSELEDLRQQGELLNLQSLKLVKERREALAQQEQIIQLVAGSGDPSTFLATLDLEARQAGVELQLFEPSAAVAAPPGAPGAPAPGAPGAAAGAPGAPGAPPAVGPDGKPLPPPADPMAEAGLKKRSLLLTARGTYPQLLAFLRRVELLDVLVEQSNLTLAVAGAVPGRPAGNDSELPPVVPMVEAKLGLTLYGKEEKAAEPPAPGAKEAGKEAGKEAQPKKAPAPPG